MDEPRRSEAVSFSVRYACLRSEDTQTSKKEDATTTIQEEERKNHHHASRERRTSNGHGRGCTRSGERATQTHRHKVERANTLHQTGITSAGGTQASIHQVGDAVYATPFEDTKLWQAFVAREEEMKIASEALLLKMKANGKELDPRYFDEKEKSAFQKSDQAEWQSWVDNQVLKRLSAKEAAQVPKHMVFKAPLRMVRVNKAKPGEQMKPKSRLVVPGILIPSWGVIEQSVPQRAQLQSESARSCVSPKNGWH